MLPPIISGIYKPPLEAALQRVTTSNRRRSRWYSLLDWGLFPVAFHPSGEGVDCIRCATWGTVPPGGVVSRVHQTCISGSRDIPD